MVFSSLLFTAVLASTASFASAHGQGGMARQRRSHPSAAAATHQQEKRGSGWKLDTFAKGHDLLNLFNFEVSSDHNNGVANYVPSDQAWSDDLVWVNPLDQTVHLRVSPDKNPSSGGRDTVKLVSKGMHDNGLFIFDILRSPQVCGAWPAVWMTSMTQEWPAGGEIDIVEYVSHQTDNAMSVHTTPGCWAGSSGYSSTPMLAGSDALNCDTHATASQGCGFRSNQKVSAGIGANRHRDGVYAVSISSDGIKGWFMRRDQITPDIHARKPDPSKWGTPEMYIAPEGCDPATYFKDLGIVINTNLGGTWPEGTWATSNAYAGQPESCQSMTGYNTAADYIMAEGQDFRHAYWKFASIAIYKQ